MLSKKFEREKFTKEGQGNIVVIFQAIDFS